MTDPSRYKTAPSLADIERLGQAALNMIPAPFADAARSVVLQVADFANDDLLDGLKVEDPFALTGLYDGIPLTEKSLDDAPFGPDMIWLFRRAILDEWVARGDVALDRLVTHIVVHELAHHLGWSDHDIAQVDRWWE